MNTNFNLSQKLDAVHVPETGCGTLKPTLKAEVNGQAWARLHSDTSSPFVKPKGGGIAVNVINHLGDEVMKVFKVE